MTYKSNVTLFSPVIRSIKHCLALKIIICKKLH